MGEALKKWWVYDAGCEDKEPQREIGDLYTVMYVGRDADAALARKDALLRELADAASALAGAYTVCSGCNCSACNALRAIKPVVIAARKEAGK